MDMYLFILLILAGLAVFDLVVGVSNDAVNFLNSSLGSKVAPRYVIFAVASLGMLAGVTFSSGMMEVARKGIFHPQYFIMPELITIFLAVMLTDILLLDFFNTFGLPTSTTVSIVFELLGAAVAVSLIKIVSSGQDFDNLVNYINTGKALVIISGILLSVIVAFFFGAVFQFFTRLIFTFDYQKRIKRYGAVWGGISMSMIAYFIIIKGAKGASFITPEMVLWIKTNTSIILGINFLIFAIIFQVLISFTRVNILKPIVLIGTFALAMAFAANDLVNFIGVPMAGMNAYQVAQSATDPLHTSMAALGSQMQSNTYLLLLAGCIMVITLWVSKKARTVTRTEIDLARQDEGVERFGSSAISRALVRMAVTHMNYINKITPAFVQHFISKRLVQHTALEVSAYDGKPPSFDLLRASVNLMVASALVSFATSLKLPLSTTYVTFMVAMGTSLSDQAWGRESAVYRITGVLTVIGGWFFTAFVAFTVAMVFAILLSYGKLIALALLIALVCFFMLRNYKLHDKREEEAQKIAAISLKTITDPAQAIKLSFEHAGYFIQEVANNLDVCFKATFSEDRITLKETRKQTKHIQQQTNIIIANVFKTLYLLDNEKMEHTHKYSQTIRSLQEIAESHRDMILRACTHISNYHSGLIKSQRKELEEIRSCITHLLNETSKMLINYNCLNIKAISDLNAKLSGLIEQFNKNQIQRIQNAETKTRLSILFYGFCENSLKIGDHTVQLMAIFQDSFKLKIGNCQA